MESSVDYPTEVTLEYIKDNNLLDIDQNILNRKIRRINNLSMFQGICHCCNNYETEDQLKMYIHILSKDHYKMLAKCIKKDE